MRGQLRYADSLSAGFALIIGQQELERGTASLKSLSDGKQTDVALDAERVAASLRA